MQDESQQQQQVQQGEQDEKKERIDELDIFGGMIFKLFQKLGSFVKGMVVPKKVE